jgi:hypothetical protein
MISVPEWLTNVIKPFHIIIEVLRGFSGRNNRAKYFMPPGNVGKARIIDQITDAH